MGEFLVWGKSVALLPSGILVFFFGGEHLVFLFDIFSVVNRSSGNGVESRR